MTIFSLVLYLLGIALAEWVTIEIGLMGGLVFHFIILFSLILHATFTTRHPHRKLYFSLSLAPLIRILSLSIPLAHFSPIYWYLIISVPMLAAAFTAIRILNFRPSEVGLSLQRSTLQVQVLVGLTGIGFGLLEYWILSPEPLIPALTWERILLPALIFLMATGFTEELVFRGVIQRSSLEVMGPWGLVYTAAAFSVLHIGYFSWMHWGLVFLIGLFFGWVVKKTGSILGVSLSHGLTNIVLYLVIPFFV